MPFSEPGPKKTILIVDDAAENLDVLIELLRDRYRLKPARSGDKALRIALSDDRPDLILLDIVMPGMDGVEVCRRLKDDPATRDVPVLFLSALSDATAKVQAFASGGVDYILKPFEPAEVLARIETHLALRQLQIDLESKNSQLEEGRRLLARARDEADAASRAKTDFLNMMSHEMRTPLSAIIGYCEMLLEDARTEGAEERAADIERVSESARRILGLLNDVLDLAKVEAGRLETCLQEVSIESLIREIQNTAEVLGRPNRNRIEVQTTTGIGSLTTDRQRLQQILLNLVSNACKFTRQGTIRIEVERRSVDGFDWIAFAVTDTGIGMNSEELDRAFEEFGQAGSTTSRDFGGTGLGLPLSRRLAELLGCRIEARSRPGEGSRFEVHHPADGRIR